MEMRQWLQTETIIRLVIISQDMTKIEVDQCRINNVSVINSCIITIDRCHTLDFVTGVKDATNRAVWKAVVDVPRADCSAYLFLYNALQLIATRSN